MTKRLLGVSTVWWLVLQVSVVLSLRAHSGHPPASSNWTLVKPVPATSSGDCEFYCFLDHQCHQWTFLSTNQSCFLTSKYFQLIQKPKQHQDNASLQLSSTSKYIFKGYRVDYEKKRERLLRGPLATGKSSYVNFPRKFYMGCSYTISFWVWLYRNGASQSHKFENRKEYALFSTRPSLPVFNDFEAVLPAAVFNLGTHKDKLFFSSGKDQYLDYKGAWGDLVEYQEWTQVTVVFSPSSFSPYVNGKLVRPAVMMETGMCPCLDLVDMSVRSPEEIEDIEEDYAYANHSLNCESLPQNTILDLSNSKSSDPLFGVYEELDVFSGVELTPQQVLLLYESSHHRVHASLPSLVSLVHNYQIRAGATVSDGDVYKNEYAMISMFGKLPVGRIYGASVCVDGLDAHIPSASEEGIVGENIQPESNPSTLVGTQSESFNSLSGVVVPSEVFVVSFSLGTKNFLYHFAKDVSPETNAANFCESHWNDLTTAFNEANILDIDMESCVNIVTEVTSAQVDYALQFSSSTHPIPPASKFEQDTPSPDINVDNPSITTSDDVLSTDHGVIEGEQVNVGFDGSVENNVNRFALENSEYVTKIEAHLSAINDIVRDASEISDEEAAIMLDSHVRDIESLLFESDDEALVAHVQEKLLDLDNSLMKESIEATVQSESAKEFQRLLINIETMLYSPNMEDESFYDELDATVANLKKFYYADDVKVSENALFEEHLMALSNVFHSIDDNSGATELSENYITAFEDVVDALFGDIMDRDAYKVKLQGPSSISDVPNFKMSNEKPTLDISDDASFLLSGKTSLSEPTTTVVSGNLDDNFKLYNQQIQDLGQLNVSNTSAISIEIESITVLDNSSGYKTDARQSLKKQFLSLELKVTLENFLRDPFHRDGGSTVAVEGEESESMDNENTTSFSSNSFNVFFKSLLDADLNPLRTIRKAGEASLTLTKSYFFGLLGSIKSTFPSLFWATWPGQSSDLQKENENNNANVTRDAKSTLTSIIASLVAKALERVKVTDYISKYPNGTSADEALSALNMSLTNALESIHNSVIQTSSSENWEDITQALAFVDMEALTEGIIFQQDIIESGMLESTIDIFDDDRVSESLRLYNSSMQWLDGKSYLHSRYGDQDGGGSGDMSTKYLPEAVAEVVESSLIFSMWLSDELEIEHPVLSSGGGMFQGCGMLGQLPRMALGYQHVPAKVDVSHVADDKVDHISNFLEDAGVRRDGNDVLLALEVILNRDLVSKSDVFNIVNGDPPSASSNVIASDRHLTFSVSLDTLEDQKNEENMINSVLNKFSEHDADFATETSLRNSFSLTPLSQTTTQLVHVDDAEHSMLLSYVDDNASPSKMFQSSLLSMSTGDEKTTCESAAAYYFPVMQYVSSNYGTPESGVKHPEIFRLSDLGPIGGGFSDIAVSLASALSNWLGVDLAGGGGIMPGGGLSGAGVSEGGASEAAIEGWEGSATNALYEVEAAEGNAEAQVWLGVRHYWGSSGYATNATAARQYFELAAKQNNGEALYCLGALYENGQGGLTRNKTKAMELFTRAANLTNPHPAALQVLGAHYHRGPSEERNMTLAKYYYEKSAELGDSAGYYSLGNLYREGYGRKSKNGTSVHAVKNNIPLSLHFLAIAASSGHTRALSTLAHAFSDTESWLGHFHREQQQSSFRNSNQTSISMNMSNLTSKEIDDSSNDFENTDFINSVIEDQSEALELASRWGFNATKPVKLRLPNGAKIEFPIPYKPSCVVSLPILKYLAEFSFRPNDLSANALELFLKRDYVGALKLFDEAAELGVELAQLNSAFIYKFLLSSPNLQSDFCAQFIQARDNRKHCETHLENMFAHRLVQLARLDNPEGFRELGDYLLLSASSRNSVSQDFDGPMLALTDKLYTDNLHQISMAGRMYAYSTVKFKDITSLMSLASLIKKGDISGLSPNASLAKELYYTALKWERGIQDTQTYKNVTQNSTDTSLSQRGQISPRRVYTYNDMGVTTGGVAPAVALLAIYIEDAFTKLKSFFTTPA